MKAKFHQYFIHGEPTDCSQWKKDYENCMIFRLQKEKSALVCSYKHFWEKYLLVFFRKKLLRVKKWDGSKDWLHFTWMMYGSTGKLLQKTGVSHCHKKCKRSTKTRTWTTKHVNSRKQIVNYCDLCEISVCRNVIHFAAKVFLPLLYLLCSINILIFYEISLRRIKFKFENIFFINEACKLRMVKNDDDGMQSTLSALRVWVWCIL